MGLKTKTISKNKVGRPPSIVADQPTLDKLKLLGSAQHTVSEAAALLEVSKSCLYEFLESSKEAKAAYQDGLENGRASLRRMQFKNAQKGNVTMQIWLGKQYLGQKDKQEVESNATTTIKVESAADELLSRLDQLAGRSSEPRRIN